MPARPDHRHASGALVRLLVALIALAAAPGAARADDDDDQAHPGTHFLAEAALGASVPLGAEPDGVGYATGAVLGFGGKLPGTLLRLYVVAAYRHADFSILREQASLDRTVDELALGGRALVPVFTPHLRAFADAMVAVGWVRSETARKSGGEIERLDESPRSTAILGVGLAFRPVMWLSVGARTDLSLLLDRAEMPPDDVTGRIDVLGSVTVHF